MLQTRRANRDNLRAIFFIFLHKFVCCNSSLGQYLQDSSDEGQNMFFFSEKIEKLFLNYPPYPHLSGALIVSQDTF